LRAFQSLKIGQSFPDFALTPVGKWLFPFRRFDRWRAFFPERLLFGVFILLHQGALKALLARLYVDRSFSFEFSPYMTVAGRYPHFSSHKDLPSISLYGVFVFSLEMAFLFLTMKISRLLPLLLIFLKIPSLLLLALFFLVMQVRISRSRI